MASSVQKQKESRNVLKLSENDIINERSDLYSVSKFRRALPQFLAVGAKNLLLLTFGSSIGFATILIPALQESNSGIPVTFEDITWTGSINLFLLPLGGFASGIISQKLGRRRTMMISTIPFILAWIIFYNATSIGVILIAQAMTGLTGGLLEAPVLTYVAEITQPHLRGMLSATSTMAVMCGVFTQMLTGNFLEWRTIALVNLVYPILCFVSLYLVPESPTWLADQGYFREAEKSLCWLRGWVSSEHVQGEFHDLCRSLQKSINNTTYINSIVLENNNNNNNKNNAKCEPSKKIWQPYVKRTFYLPFSIVTFAFFINAFGGIMTLQVFAVVILDELKTPIDKYQGTALIGLAQLLGTMICVFIIHFTGKRKLSFFSIFGTGVSLLSISTYGYLTMHDLIDDIRYTWIPTSLMITAAFFSNVGLKTLPWIITGEVFPTDIRSVATGFSSSIGYIFSSIANKIFLYMKNGMTLPGTFLFYAIVNFVGLISLYFILPETEGRTLKEIENHFAGVYNLKSTPNKKIFNFKKKWAVNNPQTVNEEFES